MRVEPFGAWESPISATLLAESGIRLQEVQLDGDDAYWLEGRPTEAGRYVVVRRSPEGDVAEVTPPGFNVRTRVHEYGGGSYVVHGGKVFSSSFADQRLYRQDGPRGEPTAITPEPPRPASLRYADGRAVGGGRWIVCVHERHEGDAATDVVNELVAVPADGSSEPVVIADGHDFFSFPRPSPDGRRLAWTTWDHPNMPWDGSDLWVAELTVSEDGVSLGEPRHVAGGPGESIFQPAWSPSGELHFVSDRSNWWNLYRERDGRIEPLHPMEAEFGGPQWIFGFSTYDFLEDGRIACAYVREGRSHLAVLDPEAGSLESLDLPFTGFGFLRTHGRRVFCLAGSPTEHAAVVAIDPGSGDVEVIRRSSDLELDPGYVSVARPIEFPTAGERTAHALHYPPTNRDFRGPDGERPPLLVLSHGGPTSMARAELNVEIQFWTSRGFAV
ncbi:MAG: S9 family peptidase, partial [Actinobacteria bacterium]|nr:S9 family peptidase [Actinomycetota bacterium]